jgi:hypothetical protein
LTPLISLFFIDVYDIESYLDVYVVAPSFVLLPCSGVASHVVPLDSVVVLVVQDGQAGLVMPFLEEILNMGVHAKL